MIGLGETRIAPFLPTIQQNDCLRVDEILVLRMLNQQLGIAFNRDGLVDLAVRIGETM